MTNSWDKKSVFFIAFGLFLFVLYKAANIALTWDEIYTFEQYVYPSKCWDEPFNMMSANNHLLNTFLSILSIKLFGIKEWAYRLPNVLAFILFIWTNYRFSKMLSLPVMRLSVFLLLTCNAYLLDFFSIARGYGLSIAFFSASFLYLLEWIKNKNKSYRLWYCIVFAALATLSHFTLFYYFVALNLLLCFHFLKQPNKLQKLPIVLFSLSFAAFVLFYTNLLNEAQALFYGGTTGFYHDTLNSIVYSVLHGTAYSYSSQLLFKIVVIVVFAISIVFSLNSFYKNRMTIFSELIPATSLVLILCIVLTIGAHYFVNAKFLLQRTALFLIPSFNFVLLAWSIQLEKNPNYRKALLILTFFIGLHFLFAVRINSVFEWYLAEKEGIMLQSIVQNLVK